MIAATATSVDAPAIALLCGTIAFLVGVGVGATARSFRPPRPVGRTWVNSRSDIVGGRRG